MRVIGEIFRDPWSGKQLKCVEDSVFGGGCQECAFADGTSSCTEKVADMFPCYCADREDGKSVHYVYV